LRPAGKRGFPGGDVHRNHHGASGEEHSRRSNPFSPFRGAMDRFASLAMTALCEVGISFPKRDWMKDKKDVAS
jgi:hypothetical protein